MLTQAQADKLIATLKEAARKDAFVWEENRRQDEMVVAVEDQKIQFILTLKRNPFEIKLHLRTRDRTSVWCALTMRRTAATLTVARSGASLTSTCIARTTSWTGQSRWIGMT